MQQRLLSPELIHVAAAGEARGRVVLAVSHGMPVDAAIDAALTIARAFDANLETLQIECPNTMALTAHDFAREVSHAGRMTPLRASAVLSGRSAHRGLAETAISDKAVRANIRHTFTAVQAPFEAAIREACEGQGPWNLIVLAGAVAPGDGQSLRNLLKQSPGATGMVVVTSQKPRCTGDVVVVVEDVDRLTQMVRVAERIAAAIGVEANRTPAVRILLGVLRADADELDGLVRLALPARRLASGADVVVDGYRMAFGTHAEVAEAIRKLDGCFVISRCGGVVLPPDGEPNQLVHGLCAPLLLVR